MGPTVGTVQPVCSLSCGFHHSNSSYVIFQQALNGWTLEISSDSGNLWSFQAFASTVAFFQWKTDHLSETQLYFSLSDIFKFLYECPDGDLFCTWGHGKKCRGCPLFAVSPSLHGQNVGSSCTWILLDLLPCKFSCRERDKSLWSCSAVPSSARIPSIWTKRIGFCISHLGAWMILPLPCDSCSGPASGQGTLCLNGKWSLYPILQPASALSSQAWLK